MNDKSIFRCAVYTRKSTEEGLDQEFNSLDAQREACEAYIKSQTHEGWRLVRESYDDGGYSGGTIERPGLKALLADIRDRKVDVVVVYKIDRLTRSLRDFSRIVDVFEASGVSFVSVTQAFNTTSSMGRLTLNVLLSFAQFEREVTSERIRDKIAASKKKGLWMGGLPPLGFDVADKKLVVNEAEAETVRTLFKLYLDVGSVRFLKERCGELGLVTKRRRSSLGNARGGASFSRGHLYCVLANPLYIGRIALHDETYPGLHEAIIDDQTWEAVRAQLAENRHDRRSATNSTEPSLLAGLLFDETGDRLTPSHAVKRGRRHRYYISHRLMQTTRRSGDGLRLPACQLEQTVVGAIGTFLRDRIGLITRLCLDDTRPDQLDAILSKAAAIAGSISATPSIDGHTIVHQIIDRIDLEPGELHLRITRSGLLGLLTVSSHGPQQGQFDNAEIDIVVPISLRRRGVEAKLVIADDGRANQVAKPDPKLIDLLAKAHKAFAMLSGSEIASVNEIGARTNLHPSDVTRMLPLVFIAPDIAAAIVDGHQPPELTANKLKRLCPLPADWAEQRQALGFPANSLQ